MGISASSGKPLPDRYVGKFPVAIYWEVVQKIARFPQGIPPDLDLNELKPKSILKFNTIREVSVDPMASISHMVQIDFRQ